MNAEYPAGRKFFFSIICPFYNAVKYLEEAVQSVLAQTCGNWELLLCDDGSEDGSGALARRLASEDERIRLITLAHEGTWNARKAGIRAAGGTHLVFLDSDDALSPALLETAAAKLKESRADALTFNWDRFRDGEEERYPADALPCEEMLTGQQAILETLYVRSVAGFSLCRSVFSRKLAGEWTECEPASRCCTEDTDQAFRLFLSAESVLVCPAILYHYRINPASVTQNMHAADYYAKFQTVRYIFDTIDARFPFLFDDTAGLRLARVARVAFLYAVRAPQETPRSEPWKDYRERCAAIRESAIYEKLLKEQPMERWKHRACRRLIGGRHYFLLYAALRFLGTVRSLFPGRGK